MRVLKDEKAFVGIMVLCFFVVGCDAFNAGLGPKILISTRPADSGENPIFNNATLISNPLPANESTVSTEPAFSWVKTGAKLVFLAVFDSNINIRNTSSGQEIGNPADIVWAWNTSMGTAREGAVFYQQGRPVINGIIEYTASPSPLQSGSTYTWAVWAWNETGSTVVFSSSEMYINVH